MRFEQTPQMGRCPDCGCHPIVVFEDEQTEEVMKLSSDLTVCYIYGTYYVHT